MSAVDGLSIPISQLTVGVDSEIKVMISRKWDVLNAYGRYISTDFILSDDTGTVIHCYAKISAAHSIIPKLQEGSIYRLKGFTIMHNRDEFQIVRNSPHMLELQGSTSVNEVRIKNNGFLRYPFNLVEFEDFEPTRKQYLIDVIGCVTNVGKATKPVGTSKILDFHLVNERGRKVRVTLWGELGEDFLDQKPFSTFRQSLTMFFPLHYSNVEIVPETAAQIPCKRMRDEPSTSSTIL